MLVTLVLRASVRINDRYALAIVGHEEQGSEGYSAFRNKDIDYIESIFTLNRAHFTSESPEILKRTSIKGHSVLKIG